MEALKRQREELSTIESTYKPIDEWVRANPDKWEKLQAAIAESQDQVNLPPNHPLMQKLSHVESFIDQLRQEKLQTQYKQEDQELDNEIKSIREKYKDLDWSSLDAQGRDREQAVLAHANQHGFKTFRTAFLDLYHDDLLKSAETRAREQFAAEKEKKAKSGLLQTGAPSKLSLSTPKKTNSKSYPGTDDILAELGLKTGG